MSTFKKRKRFMNSTNNMKVFSTIIYDVVDTIELYYKFHSSLKDKYCKKILYLVQFKIILKKLAKRIKIIYQKNNQSSTEI